MPIPAFLAKQLLGLRSTDPLLFCDHTIRAIVMHATAAATADSAPGDTSAVDATIAKYGNSLCYVAQFLWFVASDKKDDDSVFSAGLYLDQAMTETSASWALSMHRRRLGQPMQQRRSNPTGGAAGGNADVSDDIAAQLGRVATAMATLNTQRAQEATQQATTTPSTSKPGFASLPIITQRMILHASSRLESGAVRQTPMETYSELMAFPNASYVRDQLHRLLRSKAHLDVYLPTGFCAAIKTASLVSDLTERPGIFSLFSCFQQPADDSEFSEADTLRMQLKLHDSTNGLSDKDIAKLTKSYHVSPSDFPELRLLLENFRGVFLFLFGANSASARCLEEWTRFLRRGDLQQIFRSLVAHDAELPAKIGWFIERRIQSFLRSCAEATSPEDIDSSLLSFADLRRSLTEGRDYGLRLCAPLHAVASNSNAVKHQPSHRLRHATGILPAPTPTNHHPEAQRQQPSTPPDSFVPLPTTPGRPSWIELTPAPFPVCAVVTTSMDAAPMVSPVQERRPTTQCTINNFKNNWKPGSPRPGQP